MKKSDIVDKIIELSYYAMEWERADTTNIPECRNCGECCSSSLCFIARIIMPEQKPPCPILGKHDGKSFCMAIAQEKLLPESCRFITKSVGMGKGCLKKYLEKYGDLPPIKKEREESRPRQAVQKDAGKEVGR